VLSRWVSPGFEDLIAATSCSCPGRWLTKTGSLISPACSSPSPRRPNRSWLEHRAEAHAMGRILEDQLLSDPQVLPPRVPMARSARSLAIVNTDRSVLALAWRVKIAGRHGNTGFSCRLDLQLRRCRRSQFRCPAAGGDERAAGGRCQPITFGKAMMAAGSSVPRWLCPNHRAPR